MTNRHIGEQQLALQTEHLTFLFRGHMVVSKKVEDAVDGQQHHFLHGAMAGGKGLLPRHPRAYDDVAEHSLHFG